MTPQEEEQELRHLRRKEEEEAQERARYDALLEQAERDRLAYLKRSGRTEMTP